jgi:hypothetical protein
VRGVRAAIERLRQCTAVRICVVQVLPLASHPDSRTEYGQTPAGLAHPRGGPRRRRIQRLTIRVLLAVRCAAAEKELLLRPEEVSCGLWRARARQGFA